ncbi:MAG TPA: C45 family peptidase [Spirochaetia bacterium]|nr:C45 family peptidase [Spirochaetia bacterium]
MKPKMLRAFSIGLALAAALLIISCAGAPPARNLEPTRAAQALVFDAGRRIDSEAIPVLDLFGSHYEVGLQYGVLLRPEIHAVYEEYRRLLDDLTGGGLRLFFFRLSLEGKIAEMRAALPPGSEDEIRGVADGSGIPFGDYLFFAMAPELLFDVSCTSIVARSGSEIYHARNFDFPRPANIVSRYPAIVRVSVDGKIPYVNIGFAGLPGVYTGFNERGIAASVNTASFTRNAEHNFTPLGFLLISVLESSSSLQDVDSVMDRSLASHYFVTVSSLKDRDGALYESLGGKVTKVPMTGDILCVANAPLSPANRRANSSILSEAEYNLAREEALRVASAQLPQSGMVDSLLDLLGNHDFYGYKAFPAHQTPGQDSLKTINNFNTIQSVVIDWSNGLALFSYRSSYAGFGPFFAYDMSSGVVSHWRTEDAFARSSGFREDTEFLEGAFALEQTTGMRMDTKSWEGIMSLIGRHPDANPFLKADWTFSASLALGRLDEAKDAARWIDNAFPDYYLGPLDIGLVEYARKDWRAARAGFLASVSRPINSPATQLLALAYASAASRELGDGPLAASLKTQARDLLWKFWIPRDFDTQLKNYVRDGEVVDLIRDIARESRRL